MIGGLGRWSLWANTVMAVQVALLWLWDSKWAVLLGMGMGALLTLWVAR